MVEEPKYKIIKKLGDVEIRRYPPIVVARAEGTEDPFSLLFAYISGKNRQKKKVSMTVPVISEKIAMTAPVISDSSSMSFVLPSSYTLETAPEPLDSRIRVIQMPARTIGVIRFSGRWSQSKFEEKSGELLGTLSKEGIRTKGEIFTMLYNPPYTPWFMRRNEVAVEIDPESLGPIDAALMSGQSLPEK
ncbi:MAG: heme-binding protein [Candidatus Methanosuratincola sp.]|nr:heme-binding protein [Candidatus Methanosuratincola sp.]